MTRTPRTPAKKLEAEIQAKVDVLVHLRGTVVEKLGRLKTTIADLPRGQRSIPKVKLFKQKLESANTEFGSIYERILQLVESDDREDHDSQQLEFEAVYDELFETLEQWAQELTSVVAGPSNASAPTGSQPVVIQQSLPRIIPKFDGNYEEWEKFKVMFKDVVDRSSEPARIKLYHLEGALVGKAKGTLDAKTIQDGNYERAWQLLEERFEDRRRMVDYHIGGLLETSKIAEEGHSELRSLVENFVGHVENLKFLGQEFSGVSEQIAIYLLAHALDEETFKLWEATVKRGELPKYEETIQFLKDRASVLERWAIANAGTTKQPRTGSKSSTTKQSHVITNTATIASQLHCELYSGSHLTFKCAAFTGLAVCQRMTKVKEKNLCYNCLRSGHRQDKCSSRYSCRKCRRRHHTLLHCCIRKSPVARVSVNEQPPASKTRSYTPETNAMLITAVANLRDHKNQPVPCRILMDTGSQVNFISESMANTLKLKRRAAYVPVCGIGEMTTSSRESVSVELNSRVSNFSANVNCLIVPKVTGMVPSSPVSIADWSIPEGLQLGDSLFHKPGRIDMLVGVTTFFRMLKSRQIKLSDNLPVLQETHLGWVVAGSGQKTIPGSTDLQSPANVGVAIS